MDAPSLSRNAYCSTSAPEAPFCSLRFLGKDSKTKAFQSLCSSLLPGQACLVESQTKPTSPLLSCASFGLHPSTWKVVLVAGEKNVKNRDDPVG